MVAEEESQFKLKSLFTPFTTIKAIHWIIVIGIIVYGNILFNGFVWEDTSLIIANPAGHSFNIFSSQNLFNYEGSGQFRPVAALVSAILHTFFGENAFFYHLFSLSLHISNTVLFFFLLKHFLQKHIAFFSTLFFLIHPMQVESVTYFASFANLLFFFFGSIAVLVSLRERISYKHFWIIILFLFLSYFSKESGSLFFLVVTIYFFIFKRKALLFTSILGLISIALIVSRIFMGAGISTLILVPIGHLSLIERLLNVPAIFLYYLKTFFFPVHLVINQQWIITAVSLTVFYIPLLILCMFILALLLIGKYLLKQNQQKSFTIFLFFSVWFALGMGMHLQLMPLNMTVADHWFYFPIAGLIGMIGVGIQEFLYHKKSASKIVLIVTILILLIFSFRTMVRNTDYADTVRLFSRDSRIHTNAQTELMLGHGYLSQKNYYEALTHFKKSMNMHPYHLNTYLVGHAYELLGKGDEAQVYYNKVIAYPENKKFDMLVQFSYENIANINTFSEKWNVQEREKTVMYITNALKMYPDSVPLWGDLAINEYRLSHQEAALRAAEKALRLEQSPQTEYIYNIIFTNKQLMLKEM